MVCLIHFPSLLQWLTNRAQFVNKSCLPWKEDVPATLPFCVVVVLYTVQENGCSSPCVCTSDEWTLLNLTIFLRSEQKKSTLLFPQPVSEANPLFFTHGMRHFCHKLSWTKKAVTETKLNKAISSSHSSAFEWQLGIDHATLAIGMTAAVPSG